MVFNHAVDRMIFDFARRKLIFLRLFIDLVMKFLVNFVMNNSIVELIKIASFVLV